MENRSLSHIHLQIFKKIKEIKEFVDDETYIYIIDRQTNIMFNKNGQYRRNKVSTLKFYNELLIFSPTTNNLAKFNQFLKEQKEDIKYQKNEKKLYDSVVKNKNNCLTELIKYFSQDVECCVCLNDTFKKTYCNHSLCQSCFSKLKKMNVHYVGII